MCSGALKDVSLQGHEDIKPSISLHPLEGLFPGLDDADRSHEIFCKGSEIFLHLNEAEEREGFFPFLCLPGKRKNSLVLDPFLTDLSRNELGATQGLPV